MDTKTIISRLGGPTKLSADLGITQSAVSQWIKNGIPAGWERALRREHPEAFTETEPASAEKEQAND